MPPAENPLVGPPSSEVPLSAAPLLRVIVQLRFPVIASVERREFIAPFQERIRASFPVLRHEEQREVRLGGQPGIMEARTGTVWRFNDLEENWRVSLAPDFLALETVKYESRDDLLTRLELVVSALCDELRLPVVDRLGVRYIDRLGAKHVQDLPQLVRAEVAGVSATPLAPSVRQSITHNVFALPEGAGQLMARWGVLPPRSTVDPATIPPLDEASWILDIDAFLADTRAFDPQALLQQTRGFAERIYSVFRWAVTDEFLRTFGGEP